MNDEVSRHGRGKKARSWVVGTPDAQDERMRASKRSSQGVEWQPRTYLGVAFSNNAEEKETWAVGGASGRCADDGEPIQEVAEEQLTRPAAGEVKPHSPHRTLYARSHLEQSQPYGVDRCIGKLGPTQHVAAKEYEEVVGDCVQLQAEGVGAVGRARQAIGIDVTFEFLDEVLGLPALLVPGKDRFCRAPAIGNHEAYVAPKGGVLHLGNDAPCVAPATGLVEKAGEQPHRLPGMLPALLGALAQALDLRLQLGVARHPDGVQTAGVLRIIEQRRLGEIAIATDSNRTPRKACSQSAYHRSQQRQKLAYAAHVARAQTRSQQHSRMRFEDEQRVVHVGVVVRVEEGELLLSMGGVRGGVDVQDELRGHPLSTTQAAAAKPLGALVLQKSNRLPCTGVLQARQGGLRGQRRGAFAHHALHGCIVAQEGRVVGVFVARRNLIDSLAHQIQGAVPRVAFVSLVDTQRLKRCREPQTLIKLAHQHQPRVAGDLAALEIDRESTLESEPGSGMILCSHRHLLHLATDEALDTASIAGLESVGGFFDSEFMNNAG